MQILLTNSEYNSLKVKADEFEKIKDEYLENIDALKEAWKLLREDGCDGNYHAVAMCDKCKINNNKYHKYLCYGYPDYSE